MQKPTGHTLLVKPTLPSEPAPKRAVFDIEANGFLAEVDRLHCAVIVDADTSELSDYADQPAHTPIERALSVLSQSEELIGHNIIKYDLPVLDKIYGWRPYKDQKITDTIIWTKLVFPELRDADYRARQLAAKNGTTYPGFYVGSHALEAWGFRLGILKGQYGYLPNGQSDPEAWVRWNAEMHDYMKQDGRVTLALLKKLEATRTSPVAFELEHRFATILAAMERRGFAFDTAAAQSLYSDLVKVRLRIAADLKETFPPRVVEEVFIPKANNKARGYVKGQPFTKRHTVEFNPSSRVMIADRLKEKGWVPTEFTPGGQAKIDETILSKLDYPEAKVLADHFLIEKRIGQIAEGDQAWLRLERNGAIHASVNTLGAITGRCTHSNPNIAQVPKVGSKYGEECRSLFVARKGYKLVGVDLSGVELRCLSHYMARYDGGAYGKAVVEGSSKDETDVHSLNAKALGLNPHSLYNVFGKQKTGRDISKTFIYAFLYGAGDEKLGSIIGVSEEEIERFPTTQRSRWGRAVQRLTKDGREPTPVVIAMIVKGGMLKARFLKQTPALDKLKEAVTEKAKKTKVLIGLDGRALFVRSAHSALNTLLQGAGAVLAKDATVIAYDDLSTRGWEWVTDWALVAHIHDELQNEAREDIADEVGQTIRSAMRKAGEKYAMRVPIDGEFKVGRNWAETH
jgi:DNA polymerase I-like protein with 3'-5' exonuclease and polymerase domains